MDPIAQHLNFFPLSLHTNQAYRSLKHGEVSPISYGESARKYKKNQTYHPLER